MAMCLRTSLRFLYFLYKLNLKKIEYLNLTYN